MAPIDTTLQVRRAITLEGVEVPAGDYPGIRFEDRRDMNAPTGRRTTWELEIPKGLRPAPTTRGRADVTTLIESGEVTDLDL